MPLPAPQDPPAGWPSPREQQWPWWPLLPLYPYGRRRTLVRELIPGTIWSFEQLHGVWYVAVPIRMTVVKVGEGLMLYAPIPPTREVIRSVTHLVPACRVRSGCQTGLPPTDFRPPAAHALLPASREPENIQCQTGFIQ